MTVPVTIKHTSGQSLAATIWMPTLAKVWKNTAAQGWIDTSSEPTFDDQKVVLTEQSGHRVGMYYGITSSTVSINGEAIVIVHDEGDFNSIIGVGKTLVSNGIAGEGVTDASIDAQLSASHGGGSWAATVSGAAVEARPIAPAFVFTLARRSDGRIGARNPVLKRSTEVIWVAFDFAEDRIIPKNDYLATQSTTTSAGLTVTDKGVFGGLSKVEVSGGTTGQTYEVITTVTTDAGDTLEGVGEVIVDDS